MGISLLILVELVWNLVIATSGKYCVAVGSLS